jgi:hypothetical protein
LVIVFSRSGRGSEGENAKEADQAVPLGKMEKVLDQAVPFGVGGV